MNARSHTRIAQAAAYCAITLAFVPAAVAQVEYTDAISREFTTFNDLYSTVEPTDAISREFTTFNDLAPPVACSDTIGREFTVFNDVVNPVQPTDAVSREFSTFVAVPLTLGEPLQGTILLGQQLYYRLSVPAGLTVWITLDHASATAWTEMY